VVVNMVIDRGEAADGGEFVRNRVAMQQGYLREIRDAFEGQVRAVVPLFDSDVRGVPMLRKAADRLFPEAASVS
jgi:anion-transporting  ArsA/GET3 family ATPase